MKGENNMIETIEAICEEGKLKPRVPIDRFDGKRAVIFFFDEKNTDSDGTNLLHEWLLLSEPALNRIWDNPEDDVYAELLPR